MVFGFVEGLVRSCGFVELLWWKDRGSGGEERERTSAAVPVI